MMKFVDDSFWIFSFITHKCERQDVKVPLPINKKRVNDRFYVCEYRAAEKRKVVYSNMLLIFIIASFIFFPVALRFLDFLSQ